MCSESVVTWWAALQRLLSHSRESGVTALLCFAVFGLNLDS